MKALCLMSKIPEEGKVKTRLNLAAGLTMSIYNCFLKDLEDLMLKASEEIEGLDLFFFLDGELKRNTFKIKDKILVREQRGMDLGEKIQNAFFDLKDSHEKILIIGGDTLGIQVSDIEEAFSMLETENQSILNPTEDGGIYLLGHNSINKLDYLKEIDWGTKDVYEQLKSNLLEMGLKIVSQGLKYDVDRIEDLYRLKEDVAKGSIKAKYSQCFLEALPPFYLTNNAN